MFLSRSASAFARTVGMGHRAPAARAFGITDRITGYFKDKVEETAEGTATKQLQHMVDLIVNNDKWTLRLWKKTLDEQESGWHNYIPGMSSSEQMKSIKGFQSILAKMTDAELNDYTLLRSAQKERLSKDAEQPIELVAKLIHSYKQTLAMALWLKEVKAKGGKMPESNDELLMMQEKDPRLRSIQTKIFMPPKVLAKKKSKRSNPF